MIGQSGLELCMEQSAHGPGGGLLQRLRASAFICA
jgi:hypothetical protein